jgi:ubiquinone/menaquinone biosynthesis C-methylase UbiE
MKQGDAKMITEVERQAWDRSAATYAHSGAELTKHALPILIEECRLTSDSHAIEIGCGTGHVTNMMAQEGATVVGVDLSSEMVTQAKSLYPSLEFREANVEDLPFADDTFNVALINFAIHHFARPEVACREIRRILAPGGRLVFAGPKEQYGFGAFIEAVAAHHTLDDLPHGPIYMEAGKETYEKLLADSGFMEPLFVCGWDFCDLGTLPQPTQDKIAEAIREKTAPFKTDRGYEFPDIVFIGVASKAT